MSHELFTKAVAVVASAGFGSASMIVRKLGVGFTEAFEFLDLMEQQGIVGPADGSRARDLLVPRDVLSASAIESLTSSAPVSSTPGVEAAHPENSDGPVT